MSHGHVAAAAGRYQYPSANAEFNLYNFHARQQVDELAGVLASKNKNDPHVIELFGDAASGRHYLLRSGTYHAWERGTRVHVEGLSLDGYEPDTSLKRLLEFLSARASGAAADKLSELGRRTKIEVKVNPAHLLFATIGIKADFSIDEILNFLDSSSETPGPHMSERETLRAFLDQLTHGRRLVLHLPNAHVAGISLVLRLTDEAELNPAFFVSLGYPNGTSGAPRSHREHFRTQVPPWTREEMERSFAERFRPNAVPRDFLDFAWNSGRARHSREVFAQILLRAVTNGWLATDRKDIWRLESGWQKNHLLIEEFGRDLREPVLEIESQLIDSGIPDSQLKKWLDFLDAASLCHPTVPVNPLLQMIGVSADDTDEFIDWLDESLQVDEEDGILEDLGFHHPGFPPTQLLYRFRNPVLPEAIVAAQTNSRELALRVFDFLEGVFRPDTRAIANLYLRLAERAGVSHEIEHCEKLLSYWSSVSEAEKLAEAISLELQAGDVSPQLLWSLIKQSEHTWPPGRRLALIKAYGRQPDGVPLNNRFRYLLTLGNAFYDLGRFADAIDAAKDAISSELPQPVWRSELLAHTLVGLSERELGHLSEAAEWLKSSTNLASLNFPADHPELATSLNNLAALYWTQRNYSAAEPLLRLALANSERALGPDHPNLATSLNNLAALYNEQGKYGDAELLFLRGLAIREQAQGPGHPDVASSLNNLAWLYVNQERYTDAEPLFQRALVILEKTLGPEHPDSKRIASNLNWLLNKIHPAE
ncbi:MAG TPA: tetratricopeptide repeat protein [Bryobacteraceae bacterium]|jgi:tetratricopeptide (TPR) repeat protein|nr:tetratricopeptide repeat protein [Bryobacteraceae bacterium]